MVVVSAPAFDKICKSFTHNQLTRAYGKPTVLSLMEIHKECIANTSKFESNFKRGKHGCACVAIGDQQYALHSHVELVPPRKPERSSAYPLNPTHGDIDISDRQYQNNLHNYHPVKNTNISLKIVYVKAIYNQCIKGAKDMVMGYPNKYSVELMYWIYVRYVKIMTVDLMNNQDRIQSTYNIDDLIEILFEQMEMVQEFK